MPVVIAVSLFVFILAYVFTKQLSSANSKLVLLDHPNERSLHSNPTPRTGGVALLGSFLIGLALYFGLAFSGWDTRGGDPFGVPFWTGGWVLAMMVLVAGVSFWDDRAHISIWIRFGTHVLAACGLMWGAKIFLRQVEIPLLGTIQFEWFGVLFTGVFLIWMTNLYNFMDGIDGLAGGMTVFGFGLLAYLAWRGNHSQIMVFSLFISLAALGFLFDNLPPARIFMGDMGSVSLGFAAAAVIVWGVNDGLFEIWVPLLIFSPFIVDATITLLKRTFRREKIWAAHREHYYQRLVLAGWGHKKTIIAEYILMLIVGACSLMYDQLTGTLRFITLLCWGCIFLALMVGVHMVERHEGMFIKKYE